MFFVSSDLSIVLFEASEKKKMFFLITKNMGFKFFFLQKIS